MTKGTAWLLQQLRSGRIDVSVDLEYAATTEESPELREVFLGLAQYRYNGAPRVEYRTLAPSHFELGSLIMKNPRAVIAQLIPEDIERLKECLNETNPVGG